MQNKLNKMPQVQYPNCLHFWRNEGPIPLKQWIDEGKIRYENYHKLLQ